MQNLFSSECLAVIKNGSLWSTIWVQWMETLTETTIPPKPSTLNLIETLGWFSSSERACYQHNKFHGRITGRIVVGTLFNLKPSIRSCWYRIHPKNTSTLQKCVQTFDEMRSWIYATIPREERDTVKPLYNVHAGTSIQFTKRCTLYGEVIQAIWIDRYMPLCNVIKR